MKIIKLKKLLTEEKLDGLIIANPKDLFYLTGLNLSCGYLFIEKKKVTLFVDGRYFEACKESSPFPTKLLKENSFYDFLNGFKGKKMMGFDSNNTPYSNFLDLSSHLAKNIELKAIPNPLSLIRGIKEKEEINAIRKAAALNKKAFLYAKTQLKAGMTEFELAQKITLFFIKEGGEKLSFEPIIAFGENSAFPHHRSSKKRKLKKGDTVLVDIGVVLDHYNSDATRVFFFGPPKKEMENIYEIVRSAVKAALKICRPGTSLFNLDLAARKVIEKAGYKEFFPHSLGHGVGLDVHEFPRIVQNKATKNIFLEPGMVITIEPGIYLPGVGGVRLEELILITEKGYENLTQLNDI